MALTAARPAVPPTATRGTDPTGRRRRPATTWGSYVLMAILLIMPLILKLMNRSEETLLIVEDDRDQMEKAANK